MRRLVLLADLLFAAAYGRGGTEAVAAVPSFPRGPPRKPKQSGHALWVGNLPPAATVADLKNFFSREATKDIESIFLISKSNCAFVNYRTEAACAAAMSRFHDSRFHGVRLVCRLRRGSATATTTATSSTEALAVATESGPPTEDGAKSTDDAVSPIIVVGSTNTPKAQSGTTDSYTSQGNFKVPEKFFIVKSLTLQDLESSVRNRVWATQSHNEDALNRAFREAESVYLIFSANKSGEYFGYARMASPITGEPVPIGPTGTGTSPTSSDGPVSIPTPATETAPAGRIIDDSARGTVFWEADGSDDEVEVGECGNGNGNGDGNCNGNGNGNGTGGHGQDLGRPFRIEWISTARVPFYRIRGLRNPWNANREVKIARDGTELEPSVGKRLMHMFHRPLQVPVPHQTSPGGMHFGLN